jgi:hypothetical protein
MAKYYYSEGNGRYYYIDHIGAKVYIPEADFLRITANNPKYRFTKQASQQKHFY